MRPVEQHDVEAFGVGLFEGSACDDFDLGDVFAKEAFEMLRASGAAVAEVKDFEFVEIGCRGTDRSDKEKNGKRLHNPYWDATTLIRVSK